MGTPQEASTSQTTPASSQEAPQEAQEMPVGLL
jgi:hypothetical protein